jgi:hypothetical protein
MVKLLKIFISNLHFFTFSKFETSGMPGKILDFKHVTARYRNRNWVLGFVIWHNTEHRHSGLNFIMPGERHKGLGGKIMDCRKAVYEKAKASA